MTPGHLGTVDLHAIRKLHPHVTETKRATTAGYASRQPLLRGFWYGKTRPGGRPLGLERGWEAPFCINISRRRYCTSKTFKMPSHAEIPRAPAGSAVSTARRTTTNTTEHRGWCAAAYSWTTWWLCWSASAGRSGGACHTLRHSRAIAPQSRHRRRGAARCRWERMRA